MAIKLVAFSVFVVLIAIFINIYYSLNKTAFSNENDYLFTSDELLLYNGVKNKELYLSILGEVFDVTRGAEHYGPGSSYNAFIGRDASRSFVTGDFGENELSDDVLDLSYTDIESLLTWKQFYEKQYVQKGILIGRYFDNTGNPTEYSKLLENKIADGKKQKAKKKQDNILFPSCNIEWNREQGSRFWCSTRSGGVERNWIGYPRKYYEPGAETHRCACSQSIEEDVRLKHYDNCAKDSHECIEK